MLLLPLGVEAKTVDIPWATIVFVVVSCFYSVLNMRGGDLVFEKQMALPERRAYLHELKAYLVADCPQYLSAKTCESFETHVGAEQLVSEKLVVALMPELKKDKAEAKRLKIFLEPFLDDQKIARLDIATPAYEKLRERFQAYKSAAAELYKEAQFFSRDNSGFIPLLRAQFLHAGYEHLLGNMLMLLLLAFPVEQRLGSFFFAFLYMMSGFAGFMAESLGTTTYIVGASACIFGVAGAFLALFFRQRMRVWVSFFFMTHHVVWMPVVIYFMVWVLSKELLGLGEAGNVARIAHLCGFSTGAVLAVLYLKAYALPAGLTYSYELEYLQKSRHEKSPRKAYQILSHWLDLNPVSRVAAKDLFKRFHEWRLNREENASLTQVYLTQFAEKRLWPQMQRHLQDAEVLKEAPFDLLLDCPQAFDQKALVKALQDAHKNSDFFREWVLLLPVLGTSKSENEGMEKRFLELSSKLSADPNFNEKLQQLASLSPKFQAHLEGRGIWLGIAKADYAS